MTVKELYHATKLIGPVLLSCNRTDIFGDDSVDQKRYSTATDLKYDFINIGDYNVTHIHALDNMLCLTIVEP